MCNFELPIPNCQSTSLAPVPERWRDSRSNSSVRIKLCRQSVTSHALSPACSTQFPSDRGVAAVAPLKEPTRSSSGWYARRAPKAISLGYFSLGQQRKVARAPGGDRKPAAGEPDCRNIASGEPDHESSRARQATPQSVKAGESQTTPALHQANPPAPSSKPLIAIGHARLKPRHTLNTPQPHHPRSPQRRSKASVPRADAQNPLPSGTAR